MTDHTTDWGRYVRAWRDYLERVIRGIHGDQPHMWGRKPNVTYCTHQLMGLPSGACLLDRTERWLVNYYLPAKEWSDPVV